MKKKVVIASVLIVALCLLPLIAAQDTPEDKGTEPIDDGGAAAAPKAQEIKEGLKEASKQNPWNSSQAKLSPTWQKTITVIFGLNLKEEKETITVTEAIVLVMILILFARILYDIIKNMPFFQKDILFISSKLLATLIITTIISLTGTFNYLKGVLLGSVTYLSEASQWKWLGWLANTTTGGILIGIALIILVVFAHEILDWLNPKLKGYSQVSRAEAKGRAVNDVIEENSENEGGPRV